jgi:chemotaxis response regulator CheB
VLLDIWMPDTDGITLLKEWATKGQLTMPVVMMSGHGTIETAVEATRIGAYAFLEKPIALQKLLSTVGKALTQRGPAAVQAAAGYNLAVLGGAPAIVDLKSRLERARELRAPGAPAGRTRQRRGAVRPHPPPAQHAVGRARERRLPRRRRDRRADCPRPKARCSCGRSTTSTPTSSSVCSRDCRASRRATSG